MRIEQDTFSLLVPIFGKMSKTITVDYVDVNTGNVIILHTKNTLWLTLGYEFTIAGKNYKVEDLLVNQWVKVISADIPTKGDFDIRPAYFDHGTFLMKNAEIKDQNSDSWNFLPMNYLHEPTDNKNYPDDDDNAIGREATCDFYFMIDCSSGQGITSDRYRYCVQPMRNFMNEFIQILKVDPNIGLIDSFTDFDCPNWGITVDTKGAVRRLIDEELAGCGCRITIPILKTCL